jgi:hypothetical protein
MLEWQEIIITDLTQMSGDRVCFAGINRKGEHFRPNLPPPGVYQSHLYQKKQLIIRPRAVLKIALAPIRRLEAPHMEDHRWHERRKTEFLRIANENDWHGVLQKTKSMSVVDIVGTKLHRNKNIKPGTGKRSLGTIQLESIDWFEYKVFNTADGTKAGYRLSFTDPTGEKFYDIPITDIALRYHVHCLQQDGMASEDISWAVAKKLKKSEIWLRLGLGREFNGWCWLQVNGIYTFPDYLEGKCFDDYKRMGITLKKLAP